MPRPRAGDWLEDEVAAWRNEGINAVVCLLETDEIDELGLRGEADLCRKAGITFVSFPIRDRGVPGSVPDTARLARSIVDRLHEGKAEAIHCRAGIGRSALIAACTLVLCGLDPDIALSRIADVRGVAVPDTDEQRQWVRDFARAVKDVAGNPCTS